ncbi:MAG: HDOD domain-containing protein [bacterium]|nr:HDOD domain-containing protein [bacterium]
MLSKFLTGKKKTSRTSLATQERIQNILGLQKLESMPVNAARAFELACSPDSDIALFTEVIESDEVLSAKIIRLANSVYYYRGQKATDIDSAVAFIGLEELRCLLSATLLQNFIKVQHKSREAVWENAIATAIMAKHLARSLKTVPPGEAFLCGIVHDVGKLMMVGKSGTMYEKAIERSCDEDSNVMSAEEEVFDVNHVEVGKWVAESWHFPESAISAISHHHEPWPKSPPGRGQEIEAWVLIKAADILCHSLGIGHLSYMKPLREKALKQVEQAFTACGLTKENGEQLLKRFLETFEDEMANYIGP